MVNYKILITSDADRRNKTLKRICVFPEEIGKFLMKFPKAIFPQESLFEEKFHHNEA